MPKTVGDTTARKSKKILSASGRFEIKLSPALIHHYAVINDLSPPIDQNTISAFQNCLLFEELLLCLRGLPWRKQDYLTSNDRHTAKIHQSFKGVSLVAVPPWGRYRISTLLLYTGLECGLFGKDETVRHLLVRSILPPSTRPNCRKSYQFFCVPQGQIIKNCTLQIRSTRQV